MTSSQRHTQVVMKEYHAGIQMFNLVQTPAEGKRRDETARLEVSWLGLMHPLFRRFSFFFLLASEGGINHPFRSQLNIDDTSITQNRRYTLAYAS